MLTYKVAGYIPKALQMVRVTAVAVIICLTAGLLTGCKQSMADMFSAIKGKGKIYGDNYTVRSGDNLTMISSRSGVARSYLIKINKLKAPYALTVGQKLRLKPMPDISRLSSNKEQQKKLSNLEKLPNKARREAVTTTQNSNPNASKNSTGAGVTSLTAGLDKSKLDKTIESSKRETGLSSRISSNPSRGVSSTKHGVVTSNAYASKQPPATALPKASWVWPAKGQIISNFAAGRVKKNGLDIGGTKGSDVCAAGSGSVVYSGNGLRGYGNLIIIKHNNNFLSAYAHNNENIVKEGEIVSIGQKIAKMGDTGAERVKLHFEIRHNGKPLDPLTLLPSKK